MVSGLSSGIDWQNMIEQLIAIDSQKITLIENKVSSQEAKKSAWQSLNTKLSALQSSIQALAKESSFNLYKTNLTSSSTDVAASDILSITTSTTANQGTFKVKVNQIATSEKLSSANFANREEALGLSGQVVINGRTLNVESTDTLTKIAQNINSLNSGANATGVSASIITTTSGSYRIILTDKNTGKDGIGIQDASSSNLLQALGFTSGSESIKHQTSNGAASDKFGSTQAAVSALLGITAPDPATSRVTIGSYSNIEIDLDMSLSQLVQSINSQAGQTIASIEESENNDGDTVYQLRLVGTTYTDSNNVLEAIGVLQGDHSDVSEIQTSSAITKIGGGAVDASTLFSQINTGGGLNNVVNGDTILISGKDHEGNTVSSTYTINTTDTLQSLLDSIESTFSAAGNSVTASIDASGRINVTDDTSGESLMEVNLITRNEGGGTLDFGDFDISTEGRSMQIEAGRDASFTVDGMQFTRSSNTVTDVVSGVTLNLKSADPNVTITANINRDTSSLQSLVNKFISAYNDVQTFFNDQSAYDEENETTGGVLFGDTTMTTIQSTLMTRIVSTVEGAPEDMNTFSKVGIRLGEGALLSLNQTVFDDAVASHFDDLIDFFTAQGTSSGSNLSYINYTSASKAGTYAVNITQAAAKASITGTTDLSGGLASDETLTIADKVSGAIATIQLTAGMNASAVVNAINSELMQEYQEVVKENAGHTLIGGGAVSALSTWDQIDTTGAGGNDLSDGDRIVISGTLRNGNSVSGYYTIGDKSTDNVQGLLSKIEAIFNSQVYATIDNNGKIVLTDRQTGVSKIDLDLSYSGAGSLSFSDMTVETEGRKAIGVQATSDSNRLVLTHNEYGADYGFTITQSTNNLGITDQEYAGLDIAGTIGGEAATGKGQTLTGNDDTTNVEGIAIRYTGTATGSIGSVTLSLGMGEILDRILDSYVDPYTGYLNAKNTAIDDSISSLNKQIEDMEARIELQRSSLYAKYQAMEITLSKLQQQQSWLTTQLSTL